MCAAKPIWQRMKATRPQASSRKSSTTSSIAANEPIGALAHLGLARAYLLSGDTAKAKAAYQVFFPSGKMPTPTFPHCKEAKAEYAKLQ
jgi:eukaryotic-like serine/threonine-protein kinase